MMIFSFDRRVFANGKHGTHTKVMLSVLTTGSKVKMLIEEQAATQVAIRTLLLVTNSSPYSRGQKDARTKQAVSMDL